jgi:serine/threonine protein kinase
MSVQKHDSSSWQGLLLADGRYQLGAALGAGGMAQVYKAHDRRLGCDVVVKVPHPTLLLDSGFAARFALEIRSLVRLSHLHVVRVLDVGEHEGIPFAVLQYLPGGSLRDRFSGVAPLASLSSWLEPIAGALDFIHGKGYLHRDIKPENILFDEQGHAFVSDFGIAKALADDGNRQQTLTATGMVLGTPQYMAPELLLGQPYDGRVDQYALAVTVYELLAGRLPHEGATPAAIFLAQTTQPPPPLSTLCPSLPAGVVAAVQRGLARDPRQRYDSCLAFARAVLASSPAASAPEPREATACPQCGAVFYLLERVRGKQVRCRACQAVFRAPLRGPATAGTPQTPVETVPAMEANPHTLPIAVSKAPPPRSQRGAARTRQAAAGKRWGLLPVLAAIPLIVAASCGLGGWMIFHNPGPGSTTGSTRSAEGKKASSGVTFREDREKERPEPLDCTSEGGVSAEEVRRAQQAWAKHLSRQVEEEVEIADGVKMTFVLVPPGKFKEGSPADEKSRSDEETLHPVTLTRSFYLGKYEVTQKQYQALTGTNPSKFKGEDRPVEMVSGEEARDYAERLTKKRRDGCEYRLPTEAEWEYSCRGGRPSSKPFGIGDGCTLSSQQANFNGSSPYGGADKGP